MRNVILLVNFLLIAAVTVYSSYAITVWMAESKKWRSFLNINAIKTLRDNKYKIREEMKTEDITSLTLMDKFELKYIDRSGITRYIPYLNGKNLLIICIVMTVLLYRPVYHIVGYMPSALIISVLFSMIPIFLLDIMARFNSAKIRRSLAEFISVLNRWCAVKDDIIYAFEKSLESGLKDPLKTYVRDMVIQVRRGMRAEDALDMLSLKVNNPQFRDFIINIRQNIKFRGDTRRLLSNLEEQFYRMEEEYNRRRISTFGDRVIIYILMFAVLFICYGFIRLNPDVEAFYFETIRGRVLITLFCILYVFGFYVSLGISRYEY